MAKIVALEGRTLAWAKGEFEAYYRSTTVEPPSRLARREFAAFPFAAETLMRRHASFPQPDDLKRFLAREVPRHVYYSSAYYAEPDHPKMAEKGWLGADLIFDLDADHLRQAAGKDFAGQLALVKEKLLALLDDFLFGDFGIDPAATTLAFSGGRGYHVHVHDDRYLTLSSPERREIVEYVTGIGVDVSRAVVERREADRGRLALVEDEGDAPEGGPGARRARAFKRLADPDAPGWAGRTSRSVLRLLAHWDRIGADAATSELEAMGIPRSRARTLSRRLVTEGLGQKIRDGLSLEVFGKSDPPPELLEVVLQQAAIEVQGETDAPVTTDIHRLIRLPGSLHGGTGFRVVPLDRASLDAFDPLRDAPVRAPNGESVEVDLVQDAAYPFPAVNLDAKAGERRRLPTAVGLFLVLRGEATLPA